MGRQSKSRIVSLAAVQLRGAHRSHPAKQHGGIQKGVDPFLRSQKMKTKSSQRERKGKDDRRDPAMSGKTRQELPPRKNSIGMVFVHSMKRYPRSRRFSRDDESAVPPGAYCEARAAPGDERELEEPGLARIATARLGRVEGGIPRPETAHPLSSNQGRRLCPSKG